MLFAPFIIRLYPQFHFKALYRDDEGSTSFYAGIVAEPPTVKNAYRYVYALVTVVESWLPQGCNKDKNVR